MDNLVVGYRVARADVPGPVSLALFGPGLAGLASARGRNKQ